MDGGDEDRDATAPLRCVVRGSAPVGLIEVYGVLAPPSVPLLRSTVLEVAAAEPDAIVLDLDSTEVAETLSPTVFATLGRQLTDRDVDLILAAPHATVPDPLRQSPPLFTRIFASRSQALAAALHPPARRRVSRQLVAEPQAPRIGRRLVTDVCLRWRLDELAGPAAVASSTCASRCAGRHCGSRSATTAPSCPRARPRTP